MKPRKRFALGLIKFLKLIWIVKEQCIPRVETRRKVEMNFSIEINIKFLPADLRHSQKVKM